MLKGRFHRYRVMTDPRNRPRKVPSSRATMPSEVSASLVTQIILVSALVYWAGSSTKSNTSSGVTPLATVVPSPRIIEIPTWVRAPLLRGGADHLRCHGLVPPPWQEC